MKKILTVLASTLFLFWSCTENTTKEKKVWPYKLTYLKGEVWINEKHATIDSTIQEADTVTTKKNSYVVIALGDFATVSLKPNTRIYLNSLSNGKSEIFQESGKTFSKVKKGTSYAIKTPTMVAGVRGTSFEVSTTAYTSSVSLLEGKVEAVSKEDVVVIESGQKVVSKIGEKIKTAEMPQKEIEALKVVSYFSENSNNESPEEINKTIEKIENNDHPAVIAPVKKAMTLEQIKKTYGRIAKILLKNGQEYTGYFNQSGGKMTIVTVNGKVSVDVDRVSKVIPIQ